MSKGPEKNPPPIESTSNKLEESLKDLSILYRISESISGTLEEQELIHKLFQGFDQDLPFERLALLLVDEKGEGLKIEAARGFPDDGLAGRTIPIADGVSGRACFSRNTVLLSEMPVASRYLFHRDEKRGGGSFITIPLLVGEKSLGVLTVGHPSGEPFRETEIQFLTSLANQIAVAVDRCRLYSRTKELSVRDELTGLYNRRHFQEVMRMEIKRASRFASTTSLLMIDVDFFKEFNDTYGHVKGDLMLKELARLLTEHVREVDTVARWGGEEFVVVLPDTPLTDAVHVAEKLRSLVEEQSAVFCTLLEVTRALTVSIGVSSYPEGADSEETLLNTADVALYEAKEKGRNCVVVSGESSVAQRDQAGHSWGRRRTRVLS